MKFATLLLSILISITFAFGQDTDKTSKCGKVETVESVKKNCDKQSNCKHKCDKKDECKKECCKHKCDKAGEKCENCGKCECKCACKKECTRKEEHKCGEGKCGGDSKE